MRKTLIALLFILLFSAGVSAENIGYLDEQIGLLTALNIIDNELPEAEKIVTRGEFAVSVVRFMGIDSVPSAYDGTFQDVTEYNDTCNEIHYLKQRNIISGATDGNFYPDSPITKRHAAIILARVLGYDVFPGSIESSAAGLGIITMTDDALSYGDLVSVIFKALKSDCIIQDGVSGNKYTKKENYLSEMFGIYEGKGIVRSNSLTTLDGTGKIVRDGVRIDRHELNNKDYNIDELLGLAVDYYYVSANWQYNEEGEDILVSVTASSKNKVREILARDIISFDGYTLKYYENNTPKTIDIEGRDDVIYNGVACPDYEDAMLAPQSGKLIYINNGSDSRCIKVEKYTNSIVSSVGVDYIYLRDGSKIDFDDFDDNTLAIYDQDGNETRDVPVNSILSMYYSEDRKVLRAVYSQDVLDNVNIIGTDEDYIITADDKLYVNQLYLNWRNNIRDIGTTSYRIYLDAYGEVARIEKLTVGKNFGYLLEIYDNNNDIGVYARILLENGDIENLECNSRFVLNGGRIELNALKTALTHNNTREQLITFKTNAEGKLTAIETAVNRDSYTGSLADMKTDGFKISHKITSDQIYKTASKVFGDKCPVDEATKVFFVASNPKSKTDEYYWAGSISAFQNDETVKNVIGYKTTSKLGNAEAIVVYGAGAAGTVGRETRISVVKKIVKTVNDDNEERTRVTFITAGKLVAYNLNKDMLPEDYNLSKGDIVRFAIDRNYEVSEIKKICDLKSNGTFGLTYGAGNNYTNTANVSGELFRVVSGIPYDYEDGLLCLSRGAFDNTTRLEKQPEGQPQPDPMFEYFRGIRDAFICVVSDDEITAGSEADIIRYVDNPNEYSKMFITTRYGVVRDIVIYK